MKPRCVPLYDRRCKVFPDGVTQFYLYESPVCYFDGVNRKKKPPPPGPLAYLTPFEQREVVRNTSLEVWGWLWPSVVQYSEVFRSYQSRNREEEVTIYIKQLILREEEHKRFLEEEKRRGEHLHLVRAKEKIFDLARANTWDWFVTITFSPEECDRYDYKSCYDLLKRYTRFLKDKRCKYLFVPDRHKDGAYHFHGLVQGKLPSTMAYVTDKTGKYRPRSDEHGNIVYNVIGSRLGWTTATRVRDTERVSNYITKYISKAMEVPPGQHRYLASRSLKRPTVYTWCSQGMASEQEDVGDPRPVEDFTDRARYVRECHSDYCDLVFCELTAEAAQVVNAPECEDGGEFEGA